MRASPRRCPRLPGASPTGEAAPNPRAAPDHARLDTGADVAELGPREVSARPASRRRLRSRLSTCRDRHRRAIARAPGPITARPHERVVELRRRRHVRPEPRTGRRTTDVAAAPRACAGALQQPVLTAVAEQAAVAVLLVGRRALAGRSQGRRSHAGRRRASRLHARSAGRPRRPAPPALVHGAPGSRRAIASRCASANAAMCGCSSWRCSASAGSTSTGSFASSSRAAASAPLTPERGCQRT